MAQAKSIENLDCAANARSIAQLVLLIRFEEMYALRAASLDWSDPEGVHDMRVASRRLRSALRDFASYLRKRDLARPGKHLKVVADALGRVRDEDVAIIALEALTAQTPMEVKEGVERLAAERRRQREISRAQLTIQIDENSLKNLRTEFTYALGQLIEKLDFVAKPHNRDNDTFRQAGRRIIKSRFEELKELSGSLYEPFKPAPLHRMRITAKRLRYAIELFESCWDKELTPFAKEVAALQSSLGELHDADEWIVRLRKDLGRSQHQAMIAESMIAANERVHHKNALIWLLSHFVKERTKHFRAALARWHQWETNGFEVLLFEKLDAEQPVFNQVAKTQSALYVLPGFVQSLIPVR